MIAVDDAAMDTGNANVDVFNRDAASNGGYVYTTNMRLSSRFATQRTTDVILDAKRFTGRTVLDIGCGDGYYTVRFWDNGQPSAMTGIDPADQAIAVANASKGNRPIRFETGDAHRLAFPDNSFDVALIQSVLHHDDDPQDIIREAFRVAPEVLIHEPNGNNLGLKAFERMLPYHRAHHEKSYTSRQLKRWIEACDGEITFQRFAGFVPMFCPDRVARAMKTVEPLIERMPLANALACAVCVYGARRTARYGR